MLLVSKDQRETSVMLHRNMDHANGLCNRTRLVITRLSSQLVMYWKQKFSTVIR